MNNSILFARLFFLILSVAVMTAYQVGISPEQQLNSATALPGCLTGLVFAFGLIGLDTLFRRFHLKAFNLVAVGLLFGYIMATTVLMVMGEALTLTGIEISPEAAKMMKVTTLLAAVYLSVIMTLRASEELSLSIPFIRFKPKADKKRDLVIDASVLADARIIDLASSGLLDHHLVLPRFVVKDLYTQVESGDEGARNRARRCLETLKKLEAVPTLNLRYNDTDFTDLKESMQKLVKLARMLDGNLMTADMSQIQMSSIEGIRVINMHNLSNALKPLTQTGEQIDIKVQRYGKEPRQGVGYLNDGTMVVVNGGGEYIGDTVKVQVLSVKHTSSGRMVFCNFMELVEKGNGTPAPSPYQGNNYRREGTRV